MANEQDDPRLLTPGEIDELPFRSWLEGDNRDHNVGLILEAQLAKVDEQKRYDPSVSSLTVPERRLDRPELREKMAGLYWLKYRDSCHYPEYWEKEWDILLRDTNDELGQRYVKVCLEFADQILATVDDYYKKLYNKDYED